MKMIINIGIHVKYQFMRLIVRYKRNNNRQKRGKTLIIRLEMSQLELLFCAPLHGRGERGEL